MRDHCVDLISARYSVRIVIRRLVAAADEVLACDAQGALFIVETVETDSLSKIVRAERLSVELRWLRAVDTDRVAFGSERVVIEREGEPRVFGLPHDARSVLGICDAVRWKLAFEVLERGDDVSGEHVF